MKTRIVFVCLGNYCRSPLAEALFRNMILKENLSNYIEVDSRATSRYHIGDQPHKEVRAILDRENISYKGIYGEQLIEKDGDYFDYIIVMDNSIEHDTKNIINLKNHHKIYYLLSFIDGLNNQIDDPYYTRNFEKSYEDILKGLNALLKKLKENLNNQRSY